MGFRLLKAGVFAWVSLGVATASALSGARAAQVEEEPVSFREDVAPILVGRCLGCHNEQEAQGGLDMSTFERLTQGGDLEGEFVLEPGDPEASALIFVLKEDAPIRMPFNEEPLEPEQIATLEEWIAQGAVFDGGSESETMLASLVDPLASLPDVELTAPVADPITAVAFAPDGRTLAAARGSEILLFDLAATVESGKPTQPKRLGDHPGAVQAVLFAPDGRALYAAGGRAGIDGFLIAWNLESKSEDFHIQAHDDAVLAAALSPDGRTVATASYDRLVKLWDAQTGGQRFELKEHTGAVYDVAFDPEGARLASAAADGSVKLWDVASGRRLASLSDATAELYAVAFGPEGRWLLAGGVDRSLWSWRLDGNAGRLAASPPAHARPILGLRPDPNGNALYSFGEDRVVKRWSLPRLEPLAALDEQPDWPLTLALDPQGDRLAIGRYDGSLVLEPLEAEEGRLTLLDAPAAKPDASEAEAAQPELVRRPSLNPPRPRGAVQGSTIRLVLNGNGVGQADAVVFEDPALRARILPSDDPKPNRLEVEVAVPNDARIGMHRFWVRTPLGVPDPRPFAVFAAPVAAESEPNESSDGLKPLALPATLSGAIDKPGDVDTFKLDADPASELVLLDRGGALGSRLDGLMTVWDGSGGRVARGASPLIVEAGSWSAGPLTVAIEDRQFGGSGNHFYRIEAGAIPVLDAVAPLGVAIGESRMFRLEGWNLGTEARVIATSDSTEPGGLVPVRMVSEHGRRAEGDRWVVAAEGTQGLEAEPNNRPDEANPIATPGGASGRIDEPGDDDVYMFEAKKGRTLIVEVFGARLGSEIDPKLEILDAEGRAVPLALLRPVAQLEVAFRDHNATQDRIRLTQWDELSRDDYLLIGRELTRLFGLPRNPDDDAFFWSMGGERLAYLGTSTEQHPKGRLIRRVEIHPPGASFAAGGSEPVTLFHRNDDAPGLGKDAVLRFDPPADGRYRIRVTDARGFGGSRFGYHLVVRPPRPDFEVSVTPSNPDIPRGGSVLVRVDVRRIDGFEAPIDLWVEELPKGIEATTARVEAGHYSAHLRLRASEEAPTFSKPTWRLVAEASVNGSSGKRIRHEVDPGGPAAGWITVTPKSDLKVWADREAVQIEPGERVELTFRVERSDAFQGRVPIEVRNLPHGVRVLNIGLNGVLITDSESERTVFLYAEPSVKPAERLIYAEGHIEASGLRPASPPIRLLVKSRE